MEKRTIAAALPGFNDLGHSVTSSFSLQNQILSTIISTLIVQKWTKNQCGMLKKFKISVQEISNPAILRLQGA